MSGAADRPRWWAEVPWRPVILLAAVMAYADGFWLVSLQGAVGAIERAQSPLVSWLVQSTLGLPVFVLAVLWAVVVARAWFGRVLRSATQVLATGLLVAAAGTVVGVAGVATSAAYDYHLQSDQVMTAPAMGSTVPAGTVPAAAVPAGTGAASSAPAPDMVGMPGMGRSATGSSTCDGRCDALRSTVAVDVRAIGFGLAVILLTNLVLVGWVVAIRGGRVEVVRRRPATA